MGDDVGVLLGRDFHQAAGDAGAGQRSAQVVLTLVESCCAHRGKHEIAHELLALVEDVAGHHATAQGLGASGLQILLLPDVRAERDDLGFVPFLQPANGHRGVESSRICENDLHARTTTRVASKDLVA
jgi:hypothetical protein